jgi:2-dehydro-3-deoxyphosphogluconate aldolase/(4S)-4-hydroxy-2-oxoglutarate aldolase
MRQLEECGAIGVIRVERGDVLLRIARALKDGGLSSVEITMTTPGALRAIEEVAGKLKGVLIGAGTILDGVTARQAILAGAEFLVTPTVEPDVIEMARRYSKVVIPGAMTPTEILAAWEAGGDLVKVFPAEVLGPAYLRAVHGPLPQIPLVPTGGVTADTAAEFIHAGAALVCAGGWLVDKQAVAENHYELLTERARQLVEAVAKARTEVSRCPTTL